MAEKAVIAMKGHEECFTKAKNLMEKFNLPGGLLPLENIEELRFEAETGFFYVKQTTKTTHKFELAGKLVSYAEKVEGYLQPYRIKHLAGVKAKELFNIWAPIGDISVDDPPTGKIHFKSYGGVGKSFPVKAFEPGQ